MEDIWKDTLDDKANSQNPAQLALVRRTVSTPNDVISALNVLKSSTDITTRTLEKVLEIERHPTLIKFMRSSGTIPACMSLVRRCHNRGELFASHYGYLSLRCLLLSLEVSILIHCNRYAATSEQGLWTPTLRADIARGVTSQINASTSLGAPFLRWETSGYGEPVIFPFAGGLTVSDTLFLINTFWDERKHLLRVCFEVGLPGVSNLLVIYWQFATSQRYHWDKVDVLGRRNYAVAPEVDHPMVQALFKPFSRELVASGPLSLCVDDEDAVNLLTAFRRNVDLVAADDAIDLLIWLSEAVRDKTRNNNYGSSLINVTRDLTLSLIERYQYATKVRIYTIQLGAILMTNVGTFFQGLSMNRWLTPAAVENTVETSQTIGISGQAYLVSLRYKLEVSNGHHDVSVAFSHAYQQELVTLDSIVERIYEVVEYAGRVKNNLDPDFSTLSLAHLDWSRVQIYFETLFASLNIGSQPSKKFLDPWLSLDQALRFKLNSKHICAYSRCFNSGFIPAATLLVCDNCHETFYCSYACQNADWMLDGPASHKNNCHVNKT